MKRLRLRVVLNLLALLVLVPAAAGAQGDEAANWTDPYRPALLPAFHADLGINAAVPRYTIDLTVTIAEDTTRVEGAQTVQYANRFSVPLDSLVFRLYPNLRSYGGQMTVGAVTIAGNQRAPELDQTGTVLSVPLDSPLAPGQTVSLTMPFAIEIANEQYRMYGQFGYLDGILALPQSYPVLSVYEPGQGWWQETDHPQGDAAFSETAFYDVRVTAPAGLIIAASGSEIDLTSNPGGTLTHRYVAPLMRDFSLAASAAYVSLAGEQSGILVRLFFDPAPSGAQSATQRALEIAREALAVFSALYGPYPFTELDLVQTPNTAGGLEYPGLIAINDDAWNTNPEYLTFLIVHEIAHQWWYSLVGNDQIRHPWIDEALAQYSVAQYILATEGESAYAAAVESFRAQYDSFATAQGEALIGLPTHAYPGQAYWAVIYQKGPLFFAALEAEYGRDAVIEALRAFLAAYRYRIAGPDDVLASLRSSLGTGVDALYAEWVGGQAVG